MSDDPPMAGPSSWGALGRRVAAFLGLLPSAGRPRFRWERVALADKDSSRAEALTGLGLATSLLVGFTIQLLDGPLWQRAVWGFCTLFLLADIAGRLRLLRARPR